MENLYRFLYFCTKVKHYKNQMSKREDREKVEFETSSNNKKYKIEGIYNSLLYTRESEVGDLSGLYFLIF